jgi:hypothetical protein
MHRSVALTLGSVALTLAALAALTPRVVAQTTNSPVVAQTTTTYRWVDAQGVVHYSDTPQPGAQIIHLPSAQTYRAPLAPAVTPPLGPAVAAGANNANSPYQSCGIAQPAAEASFFAPDSVPVAVAISPGLRPGDQLAVTVDGAALAPMSPGGQQYQVTSPDRGAHTVNAVVHDADGKQVCRSEPVTFYVQAPSLLSPNSPARGH